MQPITKERTLIDEILLAVVVVVCAAYGALVGCELAELAYVLTYGVKP